MGQKEDDRAVKEERSRDRRGLFARKRAIAIGKKRLECRKEGDRSEQRRASERRRRSRGVKKNKEAIVDKISKIVE
jgi:hypothetical protein